LVAKSNQPTVALSNAPIAVNEAAGIAALLATRKRRESCTVSRCRLRPRFRDWDHHSVVYRTDTLTGMVKPKSGFIASLAVG
jgi:hypothetical protein